MKTIVVAVDFSETTDLVLGQAGGLAKALGATLHLVHALDPGPNYAIYGFTPVEFPINPMNERMRAASDSRLKEFAASTGLPGDKLVIATILSTPVEGILQYAKDQEADLLVLGAHGHGFFGSVLVGSVAQGVVRRAELPTLIVPGRPRR